MLHSRRTDYLLRAGHVEHVDGEPLIRPVPAVFRRINPHRHRGCFLTECGGEHAVSSVRYVISRPRRYCADSDAILLLPPGFKPRPGGLGGYSGPLSAGRRLLLEWGSGPAAQYFHQPDEEDRRHDSLLPDTR